jgi:hypothetical protein
MIRYLLLALAALPFQSLAFPNRIAKPFGENVLDTVQNVAGRVAGRVAQSSGAVQGLGGSAFTFEEEDDEQVWTALANLERDSKFLQCC